MCDEHRAPQVQPLCLYAVKVIGGNTSADKYLPPTKPSLYTPPPTHKQSVCIQVLCILPMHQRYKRTVFDYKDSQDVNI